MERFFNMNNATHEMNNKSLHNNKPLRFLLRSLALMAVMMAWMMPAKAQTDYSGVYYIANAIWNGNNTGSEYYWYNVNTPEYNWYLVPGADPQRPNKEDAWYSPNYTTQNGDPERPFLTTYRTNRDNNSIWIVKKTGNYYYIIHALTGKYVKYEPPYINGTSGYTNNNNCHRKAIHLEAWTDPNNSPGDVFKYEIATNTNTTSSVTGFNIKYTGALVAGSNRHFNPAGDNWQYYYGTNSKTPWSGGMVGLWTSSSDGSITKGSLWPYEDAKSVLTPTIGNLDPTNNTVTITPPGFLPVNSQLVYTIDGTDPSASNGTPYSDPIAVTGNMTIKAAVVGYDMVLSNIVSKDVVPVIIAPTVTNNFDGTISLSSATSGATIHYTTDGSTPTCSSGTTYSSAFSLGNATVIKAIACLGSESSEVTTYNVPQYTTPTISFNSSTSKVTISCTDATAIYYTTNGSNPTTSSTLYDAPFTVSFATTVKAIATHAGYLVSEVATLAITQVATPTIQDNGSNAISITCATEGATIYYTTDGTTPNTSSSVYSTPLTENVSGVTIKAIAVKENMINSEVGIGTVTLKCAAPVISRSGDGFTITCAFPASGVTIYYTYTTDGSTPADPTTSSSSMVSGGAVSGITLPAKVKAFAAASNYYNSDITTANILDNLNGSGTQSDPYVIPSQDYVNAFIQMVNTPDEADKYYKVTAATLDFSSTAEITQDFSGNFDGNFCVITGLEHALFNTVNNGIVRNVMLKEIEVSGNGNVGAICNEASGYTRIYNCGILPTTANFPSGSHSTVTATGAGNCAGGIVGLLSDDSRVVNCFSYADVSSAGYAAGIVGNNTYASTAEVEEVSGVDKYTHLRTMVVNCIFYGNVTGGSTYPVYGGTKITNAGATAINNYDYYSVGCTFTPSLTDYNCSWPAQIDYLTRYEFHRNLLNSNRELCGWWVGAPSAPSTMAATDVQAVPKDASLMAKWVLDPSIAPYPILKPFGKYTSPVNIDADADWRISANNWEGKKLGTLRVTINPGSQAASGITPTSPIDFVITDMDTLRGDYCYRKIQLPYYNDVFGNPAGATWDAKYGGNYKDYVVTGWDITSVTGGTVGTLEEDWQDGYNFADRDCTAKDENRTFAQGGYYYVPNGVRAITITAHWGKAVYLANGDNYYDRVDFNHELETVNNQPNPNSNRPGTAFAPAGTRSALGNGKTVYTGKIATVAGNLSSGGTVYDRAIVLVGNHQYCTGKENVAPSRSFTLMSADFDLDNEPDYCLEWQLGEKFDRQSFCPIRFDFLPVVEIGLCLKKDGSTQYYSLGCYRPKGHFEVTETALIHFGQFEFSNKDRSIYAPLILNGGIYDQYVKGHYKYAMTTADDKIDYIIVGGNVYMPSFTPGAHVNTSAAYPTRHCAVNIIGGNIENVYLTGNYNNGVTPNTDNPHCYIDGGRIKQVAAAGKEGIDGDVYFKINHSKIWEFYGGSTLADKRVTGSIDVTIDSSIVTKYCGGPKFGDMYYENDKTITTHATGTTFTFYYGGGNGGTSYVQHGTQQDNTTTATGYNWNATGTNQGHVNEYEPRAYINEATGYRANYDMEIVNVSTGTEVGQAVFRTYFYAAQFSATNTGTISNTLTGCKVLKNFYGAGNLGGVYGDVTSELIDTEVDSLAFGAGFSASIPQVTIYNKDKTPPTVNINTGIITPQSGGTSTTYTWCYKNPSTGVVVPKGVTIPADVNTGNPGFVNASDGKNYFYTKVSLENLGTVRGNVTLTLKGNSKVGIQGHADTGNVFGGGDESAVAKNASNQKGNTSVNLQQGTIVRGSVYGGGNRGAVGGDSSVTIQDP